MYNWVVEHALKETWAEYCVYVGVYNGDWDVFGNPTVSIGVGCVGDGGAICLAQKVFRKNRGTVDAVADTTGAFKSINVETKEQVDKRISDVGRSMAKDVDEMSAIGFQEYTLIAAAAGWDEPTFWFVKYPLAKGAAATALGAMP